MKPTELYPIVDMKIPKLSDVSSSRGAPMGRMSQWPKCEDATGNLIVARLQLIDGDYDEGGAYWGMGKQAMFRCYGELDHEEFMTDGFFRADSLSHAIEQMKARFPNADIRPEDDELDDFTRAYIVAAFWTNEEQLREELGGETTRGEFNDSSTTDDWMPLLAEETLAAIKADCAKFQSENAELLEQAGSAEQNGHDFYLTRHHHGVGFWDRGYGEVGDKLTDAAEGYKETDLYLGDDGKMYI